MIDSFNNTSLVVKQSNLSLFKIILKGYFYTYKEGNGLYLSGNDPGFNTEEINFYTNIRLVSSANPPISARSVEKFTVENDETITFKLPANLPTGLYDIIYCNPAGYTKINFNSKYKSLSVIEG